MTDRDSRGKIKSHTMKLKMGEGNVGMEQRVCMEEE
jgi:hypothetical protein